MGSIADFSWQSKESVNWKTVEYLYWKRDYLLRREQNKKNKEKYQNQRDPWDAIKSTNTNESRKRRKRAEKNI